MLKIESLALWTDRAHGLSPELWANAALLGEARRLANGRRSQTSDRGASGNRTVDTVGAAGELLVLENLRNHGTSDAISEYVSGLFKQNVAGATKTPDLKIDGPNGSSRGVDVKTFDCAAGKRYFAINSKKHDGLKTKCSWYLGALVPLFGTKAFVSKLIPYSDIDDWEIGNLMRGPQYPGSQSRNLEIGIFRSSYFSEGVFSRSDKWESIQTKAIIDLANDNKFRANFFELVPASRAVLKSERIYAWT